MDYRGIAMRMTIYLIGVAILIVGALGLIDVVSLHILLAILLFVLGAAIVVMIHERFGGPI